MARHTMTGSIQHKDTKPQRHKGFQKKTPFPWPLAISIALLWATVAVMLLVSLRQQQGHFSYCLDDAYIHLAIAKHFAQEGVWGVTRYGFTSAASSLLWPLLLAGIFRLFGPHVLTSLLLNLLLATLLLALVYRLLRRQELPGAVVTIALCLLVVAMPLPIMIFNGMEHCLQALVTVLFLSYAARAIAGNPQASLPSVALAKEGPHFSTLCLLAPLLTLVRFEGLFLAFAACLLLLLRRRVLPALLIGAGALLPVAIYAVISLHHGWWWLPNSVLLKGTTPHLASLRGLAQFLCLFYKRVFLVPGLANVLALALGCYLIAGARARAWWSERQIALLLFLLLLLLHGATAGVPVWYRYEAYLIALGIVVSTAPLYELFREWRLRKASPTSQTGQTCPTIARIAALAALLLLFDLSARRGVYGLLLTPRACTNIYQQQLQMARFLGRYYPGASIAANDIGAINYFNDIHCVDLAGLANMPVARKLRAHRLDSAALAEITRTADVKVAICYTDWLRGQAPPAWINIAGWRIPHNVVCGGPLVSFYAIDPSEAAPLAAHLREFTPRLPAGVRVQIKDTKN